VLIGPGKGLELIDVFVHPGQGFGEALFKAHLIIPAEGLPYRGAVEQVALVFTQSFTTLLYHGAGGHPATLADPLHQRADADRLAGGEMPGAAWIGLQRQPQGGLHGIADVDEAAFGIATAVKFDWLAGAGAEHGPGNDAIQLLAVPVDICRPCEHHRKAIGLVEALQMKVACGPTNGIRRAGGEVIVLADPTCIGAPVHLGGSDMHVFLQERSLTQRVMQGHLAYHIGLIPVGRVEPALRHHTLGRKVNDDRWLHPIDELNQCGELCVEINSLECKILQIGKRMPC